MFIYAGKLCADIDFLPASSGHSRYYSFLEGGLVHERMNAIQLCLAGVLPPILCDTGSVITTGSN